MTVVRSRHLVSSANYDTEWSGFIPFRKKIKYHENSFKWPVKFIETPHTGSQNRTIVS